MLKIILMDMHCIIRAQYRFKSIGLLILAVSLLSACASSPTGRSQFMLISPEYAIEASEKAYIQTLQPLDDKGKIDNDPVVSKRIKLMTGKLISQAIEQFPNTRNWAWSVKVIDEPETVNAWCMAGGKMAIYTGLINKIKPTDDELAQVMAHEISHAVANHTAERMSIALAAQIGLAAVAVAERDSDNRALTLTGAALAAKLAIELPNSRTSEQEADVMGIEIAARAGYNPHAAATLWAKMGKVGGSRTPEFLSTHPSPENREKTLQQLATKMMPLYNEDKKRDIYPLK